MPRHDRRPRDGQQRDRATCGGNAQSRGDVAVGNQQYQDHGPAQRMVVKSVSIHDVVCDRATHANIFGEATVNGSDKVSYRITVTNVGELGKGGDTYRTLLSNGYSSGDQIIEGGNVRIHHE